MPLKSPLVSIIIPVYNTEKYIRHCIVSALRQTYNKIELIIINDGSTDNSEEIILNYQKKHNNVFYFLQRNNGQSAARNKGLTLANGEYIFFLDSDDWIAENTIRAMVQSAVEHNYDVITCGIIHCFESNNTFRYVNTRRQTGFIKQRAGNLFKVETALCNKLYKKDIFEHIKFSPGLLYEDEEIFWKIFSKEINIYAHDEYFYNYRQRNGSTTNSSNYPRNHQSNFIKIMDSTWNVAHNNYILELEHKLLAFKFLKIANKKNIEISDFKKHIFETYSIRPSHLFKLYIKTLILRHNIFHMIFNRS
ncbi:glycosyltransferase family 2 protein [Desulfosediminicola ganghwensis]|uniref:glycosyltransferase family 2 protein n=1 Tax=Desulfosediminicola ganghwensis TaxID=2569540 RepID=UPI0010ABC764